MITDEGKRLGRHWDRIGSRELDRYLIQEVEHPAYNAQSVLLRAFMVDRLFPDQASEIIDGELYFSACASFALLGQREGWFPQLYRTLKSGDGDELPAFLQAEVRERHQSRFDVLDLYTQLAACITLGFDDFASPFEAVWRDFFDGRRPSADCRVLELGCGSANDYRFLDAYGVAAHLDYSGVDVSPANVANAAQRFPTVDFSVGDVCEIDADDRQFDVTYAFDLYEHLSPDSLTAGLQESLRVTRDELWISLFNTDDIPAHEIRPEGEYHWNLLSLPRLCEDIQAAGFSTETISVPNELECRFADYRHYNREAHILIARRDR